MQKVLGQLNSLALKDHTVDKVGHAAGKENAAAPSAPGVDQTIADLLENQRWFRDAVFASGLLTSVDIGTARATASVVDKLCAPRALRVDACAKLRGAAQTEGLPAIVTAVSTYEDGGDAAALIRTVLDVVVGSSAEKKYSEAELRVVSYLARACPRATADAVAFVDAFAAGVSPVPSKDFQLNAWGPNVCLSPDDMSSRPLDLQALFMAAALRAPYSSYAGGVRYTALARIELLVRGKLDECDSLAGYAALLRAGLLGDLLGRVAYGCDAQDEVGNGHQAALGAASSIMGMIGDWYQMQRAIYEMRRDEAPGPVGVLMRLVEHLDVTKLSALAPGRAPEDDGQADWWREGVLGFLEAENFAAQSSEDIASVAACAFGAAQQIMIGGCGSDDSTGNYMMIQFLLMVLCEGLLLSGPRAYARQLRQEHPSAIRALISAWIRRISLVGDATVKVRQWEMRRDRYDDSDDDDDDDDDDDEDDDDSDDEDESSFEDY